MGKFTCSLLRPRAAFPPLTAFKIHSAQIHREGRKLARERSYYPSTSFGRKRPYHNLAVVEG